MLFYVILMFFLTTAVIYKTKLLPLVKEGRWIFWHFFVFEGEMISKFIILIGEGVWLDATLP